MAKSRLRKSKYGGSAGVKVRYSQGYHRRVAQVNQSLSGAARRREETDRKHRQELAGKFNAVRSLTTHSPQPSLLQSVMPSIAWLSTVQPRMLGRMRIRPFYHSVKKECSLVLPAASTPYGRTFFSTESSTST